MAGPGTMSSGTGTLASLTRSVGRPETCAFPQACRCGVATVLLRYCYGGGPMWIGQLTVTEQLVKAIRRSPEAGPVLKFGLPVRHALRQVEGPHLLAEDFRVEERLGFERHLFSGRLCRDGEKPSAFRLGTYRGEGLTEHPVLRNSTAEGGRPSNVEHPTSNIERPDKATQSHPKATPKPFGRQAVGNQ